MEIAVQTMQAYLPTLRLARWAEENGVVGLSAADHYLAGPDTDLPALDQLVVLAGIARETSRLELATLVSPITFRHPAVLLKQAVTLDEMSGGRFTLGVGAGWMDREHEVFGLDFPSESERFDRLDESLAYLRAAISGDSSGFQGRHYRLEPVVPRPLPANLRLVVGGTGPRRTPTLAGRYADEFNLFPSEGGLGDRISVARDAAATAGRDPDRLLLSTAFPAYVGRTDAEVSEAVAAGAARSDRTEDEFRNRLDRLGVPWGTASQVADGLSGLASHGVSRVHLQVGRGEHDVVVSRLDVLLEAATRL